MTEFIIDPPSPFAPQAERDAYIERLRALIAENPGSDQLREALREATQGV